MWDKYFFLLIISTCSIRRDRYSQNKTKVEYNFRIPQISNECQLFLNIANQRHLDQTESPRKTFRRRMIGFTILFCSLISSSFLEQSSPYPGHYLIMSRMLAVDFEVFGIVQGKQNNSSHRRHSRYFISVY